MSLFSIFGTYVVLYLILLVVLIVGVVRIRFGNMISTGDGGRPDLLNAIRAHGNYVENAPFVLIGMISMMQLGTSALMLHVVGATFLIGRLLHAYGMTRENNSNRARQLGTVLTLLTYAILIVTLVVLLVAERGSYGIN